MLDNSTPQIRALVKTVFFVLVAAAIAIIATIATIAFGIESVGLAISVLILGYFIYMAYTIELSKEQYRLKLQELQNTIRGE